MIIYVVAPGDSIFSIAQKYDVPPGKIISDNELTNPDALVVGQTIVVLGAGYQVVVKPGDTLFSIASQNHVPLSALQKANPTVAPLRLRPGQVLTVPAPQKKLGVLEVNGYVLPGIDLQTLRKTLPHLTYLSIFAYEVKPDASLTSMEDTPLIQAARQAGVAPVMVVNNIESGGGFSSDIANAILGDMALQQRLLDNIVDVMQTKGYVGLDIDFEYIYPEDRAAYNHFLQMAAERMHALGYTLSTAVAPKTSPGQKGLLYEAHDYAAHGRAADHVILMTYEWGYTYGPPMAIAPLREVKKVLDYAVTEIPRSKILMGMPNYGYDWTLPYQPGTAAKTISNTGAVDLARKAKTVIQYDPAAASPFFHYRSDDRQDHIVWFEDARSIRAKLQLAHSYPVGGVSYWTINRYFPQAWLVQDALFDIRKVPIT